MPWEGVQAYPVIVKSVCRIVWAGKVFCRGINHIAELAVNDCTIARDICDWFRKDLDPENVGVVWRGDIAEASEPTPGMSNKGPPYQSKGNISTHASLYVSNLRDRLSNLRYCSGWVVSG